MARRAPLAIVTVMLLLAFPLAQASADPIVLHGSVIISSGFVGLHFATGHLEASSALIFSDPVGFGETSPLCGPCGAPGDRFDLREGIDTTDGDGFVETAGHSFPFGGLFGFNDWAQMRLIFETGPLVLPPLGSAASISTPFRVGESGLFIPDEARIGTTSFSLTGRGIATVNFVDRGGLWEFGGLRYDFAPTPEPASALLIGTGLLALSGLRRRRRARARR